jgi:CDP-diacylglycerol--glycerol-3-phosphate 3-phosphatidyltransferase/cardiolipin synthase
MPRSIRLVLPSLVSASRLLMVVPFFGAMRTGRREAALAWLLILCITDVVDGVIARRLDAATGFGAYLDVSADFVVVVAGFAGLARVGALPWWTLALIGVMFAQFLLSSARRRPVYDPVGRYYGGLLFAVIAMALALPDEGVWHVLALGVLGVTLVSLLSRLRFLRGASRPPLR